MSPLDISFPQNKKSSPFISKQTLLWPLAIILESMKQVFERSKLRLLPSFRTIFQLTLILGLCCIGLHSFQDHSLNIYSGCVPQLWLFILCYFEAHSISFACPTETNMNNTQINPLNFSDYGCLCLSWRLKMSGVVDGFKRILTHIYQQCKGQSYFLQKRLA